MKNIAKKIIDKINKVNPFDFLNLIDKNGQGMNHILSYLKAKKEDANFYFASSSTNSKITIKASSPRRSASFKILV